MKWMPHCLGDGCHEEHGQDVYPSTLEMDGGSVRHVTARGFAKTPATTALFRECTGGILCHATTRGMVEALPTAPPRRWTAVPCIAPPTGVRLKTRRS